MLHALGTAEALRRLGTRPRARVGAGAAARHALGCRRPRALLPIPRRAVAACRRARADRAAGCGAPAASSPRAGQTRSIGGGVAGLLGGTRRRTLLVARAGQFGAFAVLARARRDRIGLRRGRRRGDWRRRVDRGSRRAIAAHDRIDCGGRDCRRLSAGAAIQWLGRESLLALVGVHVDTGGGLEGLVVGATVGLGYALATSGVEGGLAAPRGRGRLRVAALTAPRVRAWRPGVDRPPAGRWSAGRFTPSPRRRRDRRRP